MPLASCSGWTSDEFFLSPQEFVLEEVEEGLFDPPPPPDRPRPGIRLGTKIAAANLCLVLVGGVSLSADNAELLPADGAPVINGQHRLGVVSSIVANGWRERERDETSHHAIFVPRHAMVALGADPGQRWPAFERPITDDFGACLRAAPAFCDGVLNQFTINKEWISAGAPPGSFSGLQ